MKNQENICFDLLLKGQTLVNAEKGIFEKKDIAIKNGKIAAISENIPVTSAMKTIDLSGLLITSGLIDMHSHFYPKFPVDQDGLYGINPEAHFFRDGVCTAVDTGSCGARDFLSFKEQVIDKSKVRLLAFVNIADGGMVNIDREQEPENFVPEIAAAIVNSYPKHLLGIKTAHYWVGKPFDEQHSAWASIDATIKAGELCQKRVMIDFQPFLQERTYEELVLEKLRPGDIHTHMYAKHFGILDENGKVKQFLWDAKKRGVVFDLGHGSGSFVYSNAIPALAQGYYPDIISTDLYLPNVMGPVFGLTHVISKFLSMGMDLIEVIRRVTVAPANIIGDPDLGRLIVGGNADIAVLRERTGDFGFSDCDGYKITGDKRLECVMTIKDGDVVYDPDARALPQWE